jgi:hypothetical protein
VTAMWVQLAVARSPIPDNAIDIPIKQEQQGAAPSYPPSLSTTGVSVAEWNQDIVSELFQEAIARRISAYRKVYSCWLFLTLALLGVGIALIVVGAQKGDAAYDAAYAAWRANHNAKYPFPTDYFQAQFIIPGILLLLAGFISSIVVAVRSCSVGISKIPQFLREELPAVNAKPNYASRGISFSVVEEDAMLVQYNMLDATKRVVTQQLQIALLRINFPQAVHPPSNWATSGTIPARLLPRINGQLQMPLDTPETGKITTIHGLFDLPPEVLPANNPGRSLIIVSPADWVTPLNDPDSAANVLAQADGLGLGAALSSAMMGAAAGGAGGNIPTAVPVGSFTMASGGMQSMPSMSQQQQMMMMQHMMSMPAMGGYMPNTMRYNNSDFPAPAGGGPANANAGIMMSVLPTNVTSADPDPSGGGGGSALQHPYLSTLPVVGGGSGAAAMPFAGATAGGVAVVGVPLVPKTSSADPEPTQVAVAVNPTATAPSAPPGPGHDEQQVG